MTLNEVDSCFFRPTEVELLLGDPSKARERLGWSHQTTLGGGRVDLPDQAKVDVCLRDASQRKYF
jgi:hypothetical protein